jgi:hypothetical protein
VGDECPCHIRRVSGVHLCTERRWCWCRHNLLQRGAGSYGCLQLKAPAIEQRIPILVFPDLLPLPHPPASAFPVQPTLTWLASRCTSPARAMRVCMAVLHLRHAAISAVMFPATLAGSYHTLSCRHLVALASSLVPHMT